MQAGKKNPWLLDLRSGLPRSISDQKAVGWIAGERVLKTNVGQLESIATSERRVRELVLLANRAQDASNNAQTPGIKRMQWKTKNIQMQVDGTPK
jgi:hypothetical protein